MLNYDFIDRKVPRDNNFDVIVCGASFAGLASAVMSTRAGASTLLFESGGRLNYELVPCHLHAPGFYGEFMQSAAEAAAAAYHLDTIENLEGVYLPVEALSMAAFQLLEKYGCAYRLHSPVSRLLRRGDRIEGIVVSSKMGERVYHSQIVVDATRSGDIARCSGCPANMRRSKGRPTLGFVIARVDREAFFSHLRDHSGTVEMLLRRLGAGISAKEFHFLPTLPEDALFVQGEYDQQLDPFDEYLRARQLTRIRKISLKLAVDCLQAFREQKIAGMEDAYLMRTNESMSMHAHYQVDSHWEVDSEANDPLLWYTDTENGKSLSIPLTSLFPLQTKNIILASPALSASDALYPILMEAQYSMQAGSVAGVAAALAGLTNTKPASISVEKMKPALERFNAGQS